MIKNKYLLVFYAFMISILIGMIGCDNFNELNTPKGQLFTSNLDKGSLSKLFAKAEYSGYVSSFQVGENLFSDLYSQYYATSVPYFSTDQFQFESGWENSHWNGFYSGAARQLKHVLDYTTEHDMLVEHAVANVWKVAMYNRMTDYRGPIIYSQFGNDGESISYDSQKSIYNSFFQTLDSVVTVLQANSGKSAFTSGDLIYEGNVDQWLLFANSLRLRLAMRIVYVDPNRAQKEAEKAIKAPLGVIKNNSDNAEISSNAANSPNPLAKIVKYGNHGEFRMSTALVSALKGYEDPRLSAYMNPAVDGGGYHGLRNGLTKPERSSLNVAEYSTVDTKYFPKSLGGSVEPWPVMEGAEVYFLRAEGALRGWDIGGTAEQFYNEGIKASLKNTTDATASEIDKYINSRNTPTALNDQWNSPPVFGVQVKFESSANFESKLEQIISQKWLALYPNGIEAWNDRRRTGYPHLYPLIKSANSDISKDAIIRRMAFASDEYQTNSQAVENAIKLLGTPKDGHMVRLWWDAKGQKNK